MRLLQEDNYLFSQRPTLRNDAFRTLITARRHCGVKNNAVFESLTHEAISKLQAFGEIASGLKKRLTQCPTLRNDAFRILITARRHCEAKNNAVFDNLSYEAISMLFDSG